MAIPIVRVILYVKDIPKVALNSTSDISACVLSRLQKKGGWRMTSDSPGCTIARHQASTAQKSGAAIKLVFGVAGVTKFKTEREIDGLKFGPIHAVADFEFANARDPAGNSIQISSRRLR